jgi:hypothetical protein
MGFDDSLGRGCLDLAINVVDPEHSHTITASPRSDFHRPSSGQRQGDLGITYVLRAPYLTSTILPFCFDKLVHTCRCWMNRTLKGSHNGSVRKVLQNRLKGEAVMAGW